MKIDGKVDRSAYRSTYIFIRTRGVFHHADLEDLLYEAYADAGVAFVPGMLGWDDGVVAVSTAILKPYDIAREVAGELGKVAAWAFYQPDYDVDPVEFPPSSSVTAFDGWVKAQPDRLAPLLMFVRFLSEPDYRDEQALERIKQTFLRKSQRCSEIFRFRDGVVLGTTAGEPLSILGQRLVRDCKFFKGWCLVEGGEAWTPPDSGAGIYEVDFSDEDGGEGEWDDDDDEDDVEVGDAA